MSSGGRGRDAKARPGGGCDPLPCLPSLGTLCDSGSSGVKVYATPLGGGGSWRGEGLQALPPGTALTWRSRSVPSSPEAGWALWEG